jgi:hypothetical protein
MVRRKGYCRKLLFGSARTHDGLGLQFFQPQFQLFDLPRQLLRLPPKLHAMQLGQQQLQMLNLAFARE